MSNVPAQYPSEPFNGLALVGGAPLSADIERKKPMSGSAGGIFDAMLRSADLDRAACFVSNVFDTQLIDDDLRRTRKAMGDGWLAYVKQVADRLAAELASVKPTVCVPMGPIATLVMMGSPNVSSLRGAPAMGAGPFAQYKMLPTLHPADIMKMWKWYAVAIGDLVKAQEEVRLGPALSYPKVHLIIRPNMNDVRAYLGVINRDCPLTSVDIETGWGLIRGISFSYDPAHAIYIPFVDLSKPSKSYWGNKEDEMEVWRMVRAILESPSIPKLGQNFDGYDVHWLLHKAGIEVRGLSHDLRLLHHALYAELPKSLAFMASAYSAMPGWKHWADHGGSKKVRAGKRDE